MSLVFPYHSHNHGFYAPARRAPADFGFGFSNSWISQDFQPFALANQFQLLDDTFSQLSKLSAQPSSFAPKFDVKETEEAYQLEGELPGVEEKDVSIEFVDDSTLRIKGRTETVKEEGQRPQQLQQSQPQKAVEQSQEQQAETAQPQPSRQATVEDESVETAEASGALPTTDTTEASSSETATPAPTSAAETEPISTEVTKTKATQEFAAKPEAQKNYWYSERRVGSFQRTFNFPAADVNHAAVKASLKNGVLSMTIPKKAKQPEQASRKVQISSDAE